MDTFTSTHLVNGTRRVMGLFVAAATLAVMAGVSPIASASGTTWTQLGPNIDGQNTGDRSGESVAMSSDGSRVIIGEPSHNVNGQDNAGRVRVYGVINNVWTQIGADISGVSQDDQTGWSVAMSSDGTRIAIGAPGHDSYKGHVRVYSWNSSAWVQVGSDIDGVTANEESGWSVAMSSDGTRIAIGAPRNGSSGQVRVYNWNSSAWVQVGSNIDGTQQGGAAGWSVAMSSDGTRIAISDPYGSSFSGRVQVYELSGTTWTQIGGNIDGVAQGDQAGWSVAMSSNGTRIAIGAPEHDSKKGHVRVYSWDNSAWVQVGGDIDGVTADDKAGSSVAMSSDGARIAIGESGYDAIGKINAGRVRVYELGGTTWTQEGGDIVGEGLTNRFGHSVAMSSNGTRIASGAPNYRSQTGHVRVFTSSPIDLIPEPEPEDNSTPTPTAELSSPTTPASSPTATVDSTVKKQDRLPATGNTSSTLAIVASLLTATGSALVLRRRITH